MMIVGQGCELSESLLSRLKDMGIDSIAVVAATMSESPSGQSIWKDRADRLDHLFRKHSGDVWMEKVKDHMRSYFLLHSAHGGTQPSECAEAADKGV